MAPIAAWAMASSAGDLGEPLGERGRAERLDRHEVDRAGDRGPQRIGGEARDVADAGLAGRQVLPVVGLAGAERGDDADAGDGDRLARLLASGRHAVLLHRTASTSAMPSPRQWPTPVTTICAERSSIGLFDAGGIGRRKQLFVSERERGKRDIHGELRLDPMPEIGAGGAHRNIRHGCEQGALLAGRGLRAGRARDHGDAAGSEPRREALPHRATARPLSRRLPLASGRTAPRESRASGLAPRAAGVLARLEHQERAERAERHAAAAAARSQTGAKSAFQRIAAGRVEQQQVRGARRCRRRRPARCRSGRLRCARCAMRTASTPAASSPMNVRDEPVTPWTIEMLPASRLESCARNSVGRRSLISRSLRKASGRSALRQARRGSWRRPPRRARRRRRRRSCPCAPAARRCP